MADRVRPSRTHTLATFAWIFALAVITFAQIPAAPGAPVVNAADRTAAVVAITSPTSASTHDAGAAATIALGGTAKDGNGVTACTWVNSAGGSGSTTGTTSWSIASVPLAVGSNVITVTCLDPSKNAGTDVLTVTRSSGGGGCASGSPCITAISDSTLNNNQTGVILTGTGFIDGDTGGVLSANKGGFECANGANVKDALGYSDGEADVTCRTAEA